MTLQRFMWHLWHLLSETDIGPGSFLAAGRALPICVMIWDEFQLLERCIKIWALLSPCLWNYDRSNSSAVAFIVWKSVTDGCLLVCSQGSNVIVTIVSLLPTDWTCCRLYDWQIWGQRDHICRLSLWWPFFAYFVSIKYLMCKIFLFPNMCP